MSLKYLIIVPCYNESERLNPEKFLNFTSIHASFEFLFVDDGSKDSTKDILNNISAKSAKIHSLILEKNGGKAEAIRKGTNYALKNKLVFDFIGYLDADLSVPLEELPYLVKHIEENHDLQFLMGVRLARLGAHIHRNKKRHYLGRFFATIVSIMLRETTYDTQCGAKIIHKNIAPKLFEEKFTSKWFFDVELIFRIKQFFPDILANDQALEVPLREWKEIGNSRLKLTDFIKAPLELLSIKSRYSSKSKS